MKADRFIALDIGTDMIRMGVFSRQGSGDPELIDYGSARFEAEPETTMTHDALVATSLKRLLDQRKPTVRKAVISINGQSVFSRLVRLPAVGADKISQTIRHEAVQHIPFPLDEVVWDAYVAEPEAPEPEVLLVAVKAELVNGLVHAVSANGLSVERVDVAPAALANAVRCVRPDDDEPCLLVDAGREATDLVFIDGGRTFFRTLPVPGSMGLRLVQEIDRSISFFRNQQGGNAPRRILLAGGLGDLDEAESRLGIPVEAFDPLAEIQQSVVVEDSGSTAVLAGIGMGGPLSINLVPDVLEKERSFRRRKPLLLACALALVLLPGVWIWGTYSQLNFIRMEASPRVGARIKKLDAVVVQMEPYEQRIKKLQARAAVYQQSMEARSFWLEHLAEIRRHLAEGMFLIASEPIREDDQLIGLRITLLSYLDRETEGQDAVVLLRNRLRNSSRFSEKTKVFKRPAKRQFARRFVLDVHFAEEAE